MTAGSGACIPGGSGIAVIPVAGIGEVSPGEDLGLLIARNADVRAGDVVVVTQKIVSKAEGRLVEIDPDEPGAKARLVEGEAERVLRKRGDLMITETRQGFVCANAGIDLSNVPLGLAALLPLDPDLSARRILDRLRGILDLGRDRPLGVIVSDTFGRTWRRGVTDVAIGCAGIAGVVDLRGSPDALGRELVATEVCVADEIAGAAELVMGKDLSVPVALVRGIDARWFRRSSVRDEVIRDPREDLFR